MAPGPMANSQNQSQKKGLISPKAVAVFSYQYLFRQATAIASLATAIRITLAILRPCAGYPITATSLE